MCLASQGKIYAAICFFKRKGNKMNDESKRLTCAQYDEENYARFIKEQTRKLLDVGFDRKTAESQSREIASMYRHHFRVWK